MTASTNSTFRLRYNAKDTAATEPAVGLAWDFKEERGLITGVFALGTKEGIAALKKTRLPTYEEVVAHKRGIPVP